MGWPGIWPRGGGGPSSKRRDEERNAAPSRVCARHSRRVNGSAEPGAQARGRPQAPRVGTGSPRGTAPGSAEPTMAHKAYGIYAHITWHTRLRERSIRKRDAVHVADAVREAAVRVDVHVHEVAVLTDHVHIVASFRPDRALAPFVRHAKSESSRRINIERGHVFQWARGYFLESLSRNHLSAACVYVAGQHKRHPDRVPP